MIRTQEATGKTVDEARTNACALLGVEKDDINVSYEVLEMPQKTGFLGLKLTPAKVRVSVELPDEPVAAPAAPVEEPAPVAKNGRLRTEHRSAYSCRHLFAHGSKLFAYYLTGKIDVGAPIEFHPYDGEAVGGLRADSTYTGTAVDGGLNGEGDELLHFLCCHAASLGHDDHGGRIEVREHVNIGLAGGIESGDDKQHGRHQHKYSVLKREAYYLIQHSY